ncbi:hypothetical protein [Salana multivorans]
MTIRLRFEVPCAPEVAWRALHDPAVAASLYAPVVVMSPVGGASAGGASAGGASAGGASWPERWEPGEEIEVSARVLGVVPLGRQLIRVRHARLTRRGRTVTVFVDDGGPLTGPLALAGSWDHRMWIEPAADERAGRADRAVWNDRLTITGPWAWLVAPGLWAAWQLRAVRLRRLAQTWGRGAAG